MSAPARPAWTPPAALGLRPTDGAGGDVAAGQPVPVGGQAEQLGADPDGAVQDPVRARAELAGDHGV
jgi:hypothetical protein